MSARHAGRSTPPRRREFLTLGPARGRAVALQRLLGGDEARRRARRRRRDGARVARTMPGIVMPELADRRPARSGSAPTSRFFPGLNIETERQLYYERHRAVARLRARQQPRPRPSGRRPRDRLGHRHGRQVVRRRAPGAARPRPRRAPTLERWGVRLLRVGLIYPLDADASASSRAGSASSWWSRRSAASSEAQVKEALCGVSPPAARGRQVRRAGRAAVPDPGRHGRRR